MPEYYKVTITTTKPDDPAIKWASDHPEHTDRVERYYDWCKVQPGFVRFIWKYLSPNIFQRSLYFTDSQSWELFKEASSQHEDRQASMQYKIDHGFIIESTEGHVDEELPPLTPRV
jgi:hypothetical protein